MDNKDCSLEYVLEIVGGKWRLPIIWLLYKNDIQRYGEIKKQVHGITNMMLTKSLRELEENNIVIRKQYQEVPLRVEYSLTDIGLELIPILKTLEKWGNKLIQNNK